MPTNSHSSFSAPTTRQPLTTFCHSVQSSSVAQSRPTLCKPLDCSTPGLPVPHQLPELTQTHVHRVSDAIQPSHPVIPFSSSLQSFLAPGSFPVSWLSTSGGQSIGVSASASVFPMNIQDWFPLGLTGLISLLSKGLSKTFSNTTVKSIHSLALSFLYGPTLTSIHDHWKTIALNRWAFAGKVMSLLFNMLSRLVIAFLPRSKHLLISWLQSPSAVILEPKKIKVCHCFHCFPIYFPWSDGTGCHDLHLFFFFFHFLNIAF